MKANEPFPSRPPRRLPRGVLAVACACILVPGEATLLAQSPPPAEAMATAAPEEAAPKLPPEQLDSLVAPIALYLDPLLAQTLAASTYPLEIIQLQQWLAKNKSLKDKALADAVARQPWDPAVQSMAAFPDAVKRLADDIQWTTDLGNAFLDLVVTEDAVQDRNQATEFAAKAREKLVVATDPKNPKKATMMTGPGDWPMAIPIVKSGKTWRFDTVAGRQELLFRRIGRNELDAIQICRGFVEAQHEYASKKRDGARVNQYAQRIVSTPGKQDGLAWKNEDGKWGGPVGEGIARAIAQGYSDRYEPYHGYYFKVLKGQGPSAPLGEMDFVVQGAMIGGFALVAAPADYEKTGIKTFLVSHDGVVWEKDLGPKTLDAFQAMERFDPDKSWSPILEN